MILYAITDRRLHPRGDLLELASSLIRGGVDWLQVREKDLCDAALLGAVRVLSPEARRFGAKLLVNGRPDIAVLGGAHGVHLPSAGLPVAEVRRAFPPPFLIVRSCHNLREVRAAAEEGADAVVLGPVFETPSKAAYGRPLGLDALREACAASAVPVIGLGGIAEGNGRDVLDAGAAGLAAIRLFCGMGQPLAEIPALRQRLTRPVR
jgi:thiamine-phosphate pyrophosphorylase